MTTDYRPPRFCSQCAAPVEARAEHGEVLWACTSCGQRMHRRPTVGVAVVVERDGGVLLVRRRFGAHAGLWCLPCGHAGWDEEVWAAAAREAEEETGLVVEVREVLTVQTNFHRPDRQTVGIWFDAVVTGGQLAAGDDADRADFFPLADLPPLAFPTDQVVVDLLRARRASGADTVAGVRRLGRGDEATAAAASRMFGRGDPGGADLSGFLATPGTLLLVAEDEEGLAGWAYGHALAHPDGRTTMLLYSLDVAERARHRGHRARLVAAFRAHARQAGASEVWVLRPFL